MIHHAVCPPTSGYLSTGDTERDAVDEPQRPADRAQTSDEPARQSFVQDFSLKSPRDFTVPSVDSREQQVKALNGDPTFTVTQSQLMEIERRACHDVTATSFCNSPVRPKQLSYGSPHDEVETNLQPPALGREESGFVAGQLPRDIRQSYRRLAPA